MQTQGVIGTKLLRNKLIMLVSGWALLDLPVMTSFSSLASKTI